MHRKIWPLEWGERGMVLGGKFEGRSLTSSLDLFSSPRLVEYRDTLVVYHQRTLCTHELHGGEQQRTLCTLIFAERPFYIGHNQTVVLEAAELFVPRS